MNNCDVCGSINVSLYQIDNKKEMRYHYIEKCDTSGKERKINTLYCEFYG